MRILRVFRHLAARAGACVACRVGIEARTGCDGDVTGARQPRGRIRLWGEIAALPGGKENHALFEDASRWRCVTFGPSFGAAIDDTGAVYVWGQMEDGRFVEPQALEGAGIVDCRCSATDLYMLGADGNVYVLRDISHALRERSETSGNRVQSSNVESGDEGATGASGHGSGTVARPQHAGEQAVDKASLPTPERVQGLSGKRIVKMSVGNAHAAFLADDGSLYCSGDNSFGQCGTKPSNVSIDLTFMWLPRSGAVPQELIGVRKVEFKDPTTSIVDVVCGGRHTCCVDSWGNVYTFGDDSSVQLFLGDTRGRTLLEHEQYRPFASPSRKANRSYTTYTQTDRHLQFNPIPVTRVGKLSEYMHLIRGAPATLAAGDDFTVVAATPEAQGSDRATHLIASGDNRFCQCTGVDVRMIRPRVTRLSGVLLPHSLGCGSSHCMAALTNGQILGWGSNKHRQFGPNKRTVLTAPTAILPPEHTDEGGASEPLPPETIQFMRCSFNNTAIITNS
ncbi:hypothetical protein, conserved [Babesia bigemina]|uniref:Uncharacterized protein n=1 Tax=Babesia bigemina TaxID=5866 RepID=A0A061DAF9_BABBI|nr:hypothetical protein, conserved [Babesia bigemina]CDR97686.1 hypothetical protein, conserved [Babesia bigemina]|eukprot:XP_012769872.1 hypothetical protein, conserved [Babesia bigemina]